MGSACPLAIFDDAIVPYHQQSLVIAYRDLIAALVIFAIVNVHKCCDWWVHGQRTALASNDVDMDNEADGDLDDDRGRRRRRGWIGWCQGLGLYRGRAFILRVSRLVLFVV